MKKDTSNGFSLVEVMVVVSTVSMVMAVTMPAMNKARGHARAIVCRSNLRQLVLANIGYSNDSGGYYVPAAQDYWRNAGILQGGYHRWHGVRDGNDAPFDPLKGPLAEYLGDGQVKECPEPVIFTKDQSGIINFEKGCGGYGYNMQYLGSRLWRNGLTTLSIWRKAHAETTNVAEVKMPFETLMFADTAFYKEYQNNWYLVEYSFAQPRYWVLNGNPDVTGRAMGFPVPSIHFRHLGKANVGWADGHIEPKPMANLEGKPGYNAACASVNIGWFEPVDNSLFDLK
ncbi:MAG: prepilin-type N-terminal cleavage/methylation domain-containing protein [Sedimentisphaerales bacterium]|nr:prepilin-type N-terminal cleavage/methylation domain-containing protein [Sedimentisphaerales bacterium]